MNLSRVSNSPNIHFSVELTLFELRLKFKSRLKFLKFGLKTYIDNFLGIQYM